MKEKKVYVFFNCDEEKSQTSMNIFYNSTVYGDTKKARKELLAKVSAAIMEGDPSNAKDFITYGSIEAFTQV